MCGRGVSRIHGVCAYHLIVRLPQLRRLSPVGAPHGPSGHAFRHRGSFCGVATKSGTLFGFVFFFGGFCVRCGANLQLLCSPLCLLCVLSSPLETGGKESLITTGKGRAVCARQPYTVGTRFVCSAPSHRLILPFITPFPFTSKENRLLLPRFFFWVVRRCGLGNCKKRSCRFI